MLEHAGICSTNLIGLLSTRNNCISFFVPVGLDAFIQIVHYKQTVILFMSVASSDDLCQQAAD